MRVLLVALLAAISYAQTDFRRQLETDSITECVNDETQAETLIAPLLPAGIAWNGCQTVAGYCNLDPNIPLICCETCPPTEPSSTTVSPTPFPSTAESACPKWVLANEKENCHEVCGREESNKYCTEEFWPETEHEFLYDVLPAVNETIVCDDMSLGSWIGNPSIFMYTDRRGIPKNKCYWGLFPGTQPHGRCEVTDEDDGGDFRVCCCTNEPQPETTDVPKRGKTKTNDLIAEKWWFWLLIVALLFAITTGTFYIVGRRSLPENSQESKQQHLPDAFGSTNYVVEVGRASGTF